MSFSWGSKGKNGGGEESTKKIALGHRGVLLTAMVGGENKHYSKRFFFSHSSGNGVVG